jgi:C-terminal processing protease CtpA/Prc
MYQALEDGAENVAIDLTTNGGGNSYALEGVVGLLNGAKSDFNSVEVVSKCKTTEKHLLDINLDGQFNELDVTEANKFKALNIGIITSAYSFSCANLLPSTLKELGYKIIGEQSGGGSCAISIESTADGLEYVRSSNICLADKNGNNIDSGVPVDLEIEHPLLEDSETLMDYTQFFNLESLGTYLSSAY